MSPQPLSLGGVIIRRVTPPVDNPHDALKQAWEHYLDRKQVLVLDVEPAGDRVYEVGLVRGDWRHTTFEDFIVDPGRDVIVDRPMPTDKRAERLALVKGAGSFAEHFGRIAAFCRPVRHFVAWNVSSDRDRFLGEFWRENAPFPEIRWIDAMKIAEIAWDYRKPKLRDVANERLTLARRQGLLVDLMTGDLVPPFRSAKVSVSRLDAEVDTPSALIPVKWQQNHHALADARVTFMVFRRALVELHRRGVPRNHLPVEAGFLGDDWPADQAVGPAKRRPDKEHFVPEVRAVIGSPPYQGANDCLGLDLVTATGPR